MDLSATAVRLAAVAAIFAAMLVPMSARTTVFPPEGGRGDAAGELRCPAGMYLVGLKGGVGNWIDRIGVMCRRIDPPDYAWGVPSAVGAFGGSGGAPFETLCPRDSAVRNLAVRIEVVDGLQKAPMGIAFRCQQPRDGRATGDFSIGYVGHADLTGDALFRPYTSTAYRHIAQSCPGDEYAVGLNLRHGQHVNAIGLICENITVPAQPAGGEPIGRGMEDNTNRVGADYRRFELGRPDPAACQRACRDDSSRCNAWTYVRPGQQGPKAMCYLKREAPPPSRHPCCISGENRVILVMPPLGTTPPSGSPPPGGGQAPGGAFEPNTDRPGMDIARIELNAPDPLRCQRRCNDRGECRAWTYVRPGLQGPRAVCYLKSAAPPPKPSNCCVSGVK